MTDNRPQILFVGSREIREIPKGWQHPKDARGKYVPLLPADHIFADEEKRETMPRATGETEIMAYEATTEGTPISSAFPNTPQGKLGLVTYCAAHATTFGDHRADAEAWAAILFGDASVGIDGTVRAS